MAALLAFGGLALTGTGVLESTGSVGNTKTPVVYMYSSHRLVDMPYTV